MSKSKVQLIRIVFGAVLAAMVFVVTMFRFPLLGSKVHFANAVCLLSGLLLGPVWGGFAAGMGSMLYDLFLYNEGIINLLITFVSKFAMAWVTAMLFRAFGEKRRKPVNLVIVCAAGALTYVALYMLKTFIYNKFVYGYPIDAVGATMIAKLIPSLLNAAVAVVAAPLFYHAVLPALRSSGLLKRMRAEG